MMIGTLIGSGVAACLIYSSMKWQPKELNKIQHVFRNVGYRVKDRDPKFIRKDITDNYTDYIFSVPYGLIDDKKLQPILEKTLIKPVTIYFRGVLIVRVYNTSLPKQIKYDWPRTDKWIVPIGRSLNGTIYHNFDQIPHMTVAGMTRQGKTVFLKLLFAHLIHNNPSVEFYILDLKGGLEFSKYERVQQVKNVSSNVSEASNVLSYITSLIKGDMSDFKAKGHNNITHTKITRRRFIIVDEAAELDKDCQSYLSEIARIGGALGYRLIFATQYPTADTLPRQIKQNSDAKISFRLPTEVASRVAIDEQGAEQLTCPGRAIYRTHERVEIQVPYIDDKEILERLDKYVVDDPKIEQIRTDTIEFG